MWCPIARLELAIQGRTDFVQSILTAVFGESDETKEERKLREQTPNPDLAARQFLDFVSRSQAHARRQAPKKNP